MTCKARLNIKGDNFEIQIPGSNCFITSDNLYSRPDAARRAASKVASRLKLMLDWKK